LLNQFTPDAVAQIAFGKYLSPDYQVHPGEFIPETGTLTGTPVAQGVNQIYFNLFAPSGPKPVQGWPVAIWDPSTNTLYAESDALQAARLAGVQDDNAKASAERPPEVAMREESRSAEPSPSKSMPIWISRTSCSNDSKQLEFRFHDDLLLMRRDS